MMEHFKFCKNFKRLHNNYCIIIKYMIISTKKSLTKLLFEFFFNHINTFWYAIINIKL